MSNDLTYIYAKHGKGKLASYSATKNLNVIQFFKENKDELNQQILECGGILLRDFSIRAVSEFNQLANIVSPQLFDYVNRSTPRTKLGNKIYTTTEYPSEKHIPFHNENSYTLTWPGKIMFFCVVAPEVGGETPIADSRQVCNKIDKKIINIFNEKKILYLRKFIPGIDLSWQEVFQTEDKQDVEKYCIDNKINYSWQDSNNVELITKQLCQATLSHPVTGEIVWFNQAHLFNIWSLPEPDKSMLINTLGNNNLPRNSYFGDNSEIDPEYFINISDAYEQERIEFKWKKGDILILDNILMAHARNPFSGARKIVAAMGT